MYSEDALAEAVHQALDHLGPAEALEVLNNSGHAEDQWSAELLALASLIDIGRGDLNVARDRIEIALNKDPEDPTALAVGAIIEDSDATSDGVPERATTAFDRAVERNDACWFGLTAAAIHATRTRDEARAIRLVDRAIELYPDSPSCQLCKSEVFERLFISEEAKLHFENALARFPNHPQALARVALNGFRQLRSAQETARRAIAVSPAHSDANLVTAVLYTIEGENDLAEPYALKALEFNSSSDMALKVLENIARSRHDHDSAKEWSDRLVDLDPSNAMTKMFTIAMGASKDPAGAYSALSDFEKEGPAPVSRAARHNMLSYLSTYRYLPIRSLLDQIEADRNRWDAWYLFSAELAQGTGGKKAVLDLYHEGLKRYPGDGKLQAGLLTYLHRIHESDAFEQARKKLFDGGPESPVQVIHVIRAFATMQRFDWARELLDRATHEFPKSVAIKSERINVASLEGDLHAVRDGLLEQGLSLWGFRKLIVRTLWNGIKRKSPFRSSSV